MRGAVAILAAFWSVSPAIAGSFVYISVGGENKIAMYRMDQERGTLEHQGDVDVGGAPGSQAVDSKRQFLFASVRSTQQLASLRIDAKTGRLAKISTVETGVNAAYVATDRADRFLLSASYSAGKVAVHAIDQNGRIAGEAQQWIETAERAHAILPDLSNRFVFVPHTGPNAIFQFKFDQETGSLAANEPAKVIAPEGAEPRHLAFHPNGKFVFFDNEKGSSVTTYRLDNATGSLAELDAVSTLPSEFTGRNTCADIEITPDGRYVFASNRGHNSIASFSVNADTGELTPVEQAATEDTPRSFNIDPSGKFLYAAGQRSGKLAAYRIDKNTGRLKRFQTYTVGRSPSWVQVVVTSE